MALRKPLGASRLLLACGCGTSLPALINPANGTKALPTFLCVIIDDHSHLFLYAAYYLQADTQAFHQTLKEGLRRRSLTVKFYTDQGGSKKSTHRHNQSSTSYYDNNTARQFVIASRSSCRRTSR